MRKERERERQIRNNQKMTSFVNTVKKTADVSSSSSQKPESQQRKFIQHISTYDENASSVELPVVMSAHIEEVSKSSGFESKLIGVTFVHIVPRSVLMCNLLSDMSEPYKFLTQQQIAVCIDTSKDIYCDMSATCKRAGCTLLHIPLDIKHELSLPRLELLSKYIKTVYAAMILETARDNNAAVCVYDRNGGGTSALIAASLACLEYRCSPLQACAGVTVLHNARKNIAGMTREARLLPDGDKLKKAADKLFAMILQQDVGSRHAGCAREMFGMLPPGIVLFMPDEEEEKEKEYTKRKILDRPDRGDDDVKHRKKNNAEELFYGDF